MKKLVSIMLIMILVLSSIISAGAYDPLTPQEEVVYLYEDRFVEEYVDVNGFSDTYWYREIYYHYDENGQVDWALVSAHTTMQLPWLISQIICDRVLTSYNESVPFRFGYAVYDVANDKFVVISESMLDSYDGLREYWTDNKVGRLIGDADFDGELSILDATHIQRALAKLCEFNENDYIEGYSYSGSTVRYISDFDRDGDRSVLDATAIQRKLARLDSEPVVNKEIVLHAIDDYDEFWNLESMPDEATTVDFVMEYDKQQFSDVVYNFGVDGEWGALAIIKSKEQYDIVFNDRAPEFTDEFFDSKWLVVTIKYCGCHEATAPITDIAKNGDTLYVRANTYVPEGPISPTTPRWLSMVSVDKNLLYDVNNIVLVK